MDRPAEVLDRDGFELLVRPEVFQVAFAVIVKLQQEMLLYRDPLKYKTL